MPETRMVKAIHSWKPISNRPTERPKTPWEDDVKKDIQKLKMPNWRTLVQDRRRWKELVRRPKLCTKSCRAVIIRRRYLDLLVKSTYISISFMVCFLTSYYLGDYMKNEINGACSTYGRQERCI
jgi:hypothetical protein